MQQTLGDLLRGRGLYTPATIAIRVALHPDDVSADFPDTEAMVQAGVIGMYDRMQDEPLIADDSPVLSFVACDADRARLTAFRRFKLRARGNVPGDIVYDYDAAHLLHAFIARATQPMFYDALDLDGLDDCIGHLVVRWPPSPPSAIRAIDDIELA